MYFKASFFVFHGSVVTIETQTRWPPKKSKQNWQFSSIYYMLLLHILLKIMHGKCKKK